MRWPIRWARTPRPPPCASTTADAMRSRTPCAPSQHDVQAGPAASPEDITEDTISAPSVHRPHARPRPDHPAVRRGAHLQLPAVAVGVQRVLLYRRAVAGLLDPGYGRRDRRTSTAGPADLEGCDTNESKSSVWRHRICVSSCWRSMFCRPSCWRLAVTALCVLASV